MVQERGWIMVLHAIIAAAAAWLVMSCWMKLSNAVVEDRTMLVMASALMYMVLFGHGAPTKLNPNVRLF
jgi:hypothetical protein